MGDKMVLFKKSYRIMFFFLGVEMQKYSKNIKYEH